MHTSRFAISMLNLILFATPTSGQTVGDRGTIASTVQQALRSEGCGSCRAWASGVENKTIEILDPFALSTPNDYRGRPTYYYGAGFRNVIYYSSPGVVYARHSVDMIPPRADLPAPRESIARRPAVSAKPTTPLRKRLSEDDAFQLLYSKLLEMKPYSWTKDLKCIHIYSDKPKSEYYEFSLHEYHNPPSCGGDPETGPRLDSFRVHKLTGKIEWEDIDGGYRRLDAFRKSRAR